MEFSQQIKDFLKDTYPNKDIYNMSLDELKMFKNEVTDKKHEYSLLELAVKTCMNAAYGSAANQWFYFFNNKVAADITGECRNLTKTMWSNLENFFHETIWERKDLLKQFDFELDESKHEWYRTQNVAVYSDTDSTGKDSNLLLINNDNKKEKMSIEELYNKSLEKNKDNIIKTKSGQEIILCDDYKVLNYNDNGLLKYCPINYIMRHKTNKKKFKITTKSGKNIIVTEDHSCIVFRDGKKITIKAKDINIKKDKILSIYEKE